MKRKTTIPPKYRKKKIPTIIPPNKKEQQSERGKVLDALQNLTQENGITPTKTLHWDYGDDPQAKEIFDKHHRKRKEDKNTSKDTYKGRRDPESKGQPRHILSGLPKRNIGGPVDVLYVISQGMMRKTVQSYLK